MCPNYRAVTPPPHSELLPLQTWTGALEMVPEVGSKQTHRHQWINKLWSIHTMGYYWAIKRKEGLTHRQHGINLENLMLSEKNQTQKATRHVIY